MTKLMLQMMTITRVALFVASGGAAFAGGDDYDASKDEAGAGPAYFGFVRDTRGSPISDAQVVLQSKSGDPLMIKTNVLGLYRGHVSAQVAPDDVQITCAKDGYKQARVSRRTPAGAKNMFIETDCTLQRL